MTPSHPRWKPRQKRADRAERHDPNAGLGGTPKPIEDSGQAAPVTGADAKQPEPSEKSEENGGPGTGGGERVPRRARQPEAEQASKEPDQELHESPKSLKTTEPDKGKRAWRGKRKRDGWEDAPKGDEEPEE
jgi:hypothetical protein